MNAEQGDRPEWLKCIARERLEIAHKSWCGRDRAPLEWRFTGVGHAAENALAGGRLVACPDCVLAAFDALASQTTA